MLELTIFHILCLRQACYFFFFFGLIGLGGYGPFIFFLYVSLRSALCHLEQIPTSNNSKINQFVFTVKSWKACIDPEEHFPFRKVSLQKVEPSKETLRNLLPTSVLLSEAVPLILCSVYCIDKDKPSHFLNTSHTKPSAHSFIYAVRTKCL